MLPYHLVFHHGFDPLATGEGRSLPKLNLATKQAQSKHVPDEKSAPLRQRNTPHHRYPQQTNRSREVSVEVYLLAHNLRHRSYTLLCDRPSALRQRYRFLAVRQEIHLKS